MTTKAAVWDSTVKQSGQSMIFGQIVRTLKLNKVAEKNIDLTDISTGLSQLNPRMRKAVMEIITDYNVSNPEVFKVMGKKGGAPYGGIYDSSVNSTSFDLSKFPDSLIIILEEFIILNRKHAKKKK